MENLNQLFNNVDLVDLYTCSSCYIAKPSTLYHKDKSKSTGIKSQCIECRNNTRRKVVPTVKTVKMVKTCTKCKVEKDLENFRNTVQYEKPYTMPLCKECEKLYKIKEIQKIMEISADDRHESMYICQQCKIEKPISDYKKNKSAKRGHDNKCSVCRDALIAEKREAERQRKLSRESVRPEGQFMCSLCKISKPAEDFHLNTTIKRGVCSYCKVCKHNKDMEKLRQMYPDYYTDKF
jgi:hypothetical protein